MSALPDSSSLCEDKCFETAVFYALYDNPAISWDPSKSTKASKTTPKTAAAITTSSTKSSFPQSPALINKTGVQLAGISLITHEYPLAPGFLPFWGTLFLRGALSLKNAFTRS